MLTCCLLTVLDQPVTYTSDSERKNTVY